METKQVTIYALVHVLLLCWQSYYIPSYAILCYLVHYHKSKLKPINATESTDLINSGAKIRFIEWVVWAEDGGGGTQRILLK